jgi:hypothetical protein
MAMLKFAQIPVIPGRAQKFTRVFDALWARTRNDRRDWQNKPERGAPG